MPDAAGHRNARGVFSEAGFLSQKRNLFFAWKYWHPLFLELGLECFSLDALVPLALNIDYVGYSSWKKEFLTLGLWLSPLLPTRGSMVCPVLHTSNLQTVHDINERYCIHRAFGTCSLEFCPCVILDSSYSHIFLLEVLVFTSYSPSSPQSSGRHKNNKSLKKVWRHWGNLFLNMGSSSV